MCLRVRCTRPEQGGRAAGILSPSGKTETSKSACVSVIADCSTVLKEWNAETESACDASAIPRGAADSQRGLRGGILARAGTDPARGTLAARAGQRGAGVPFDGASGRRAAGLGADRKSTRLN